MTSIMDTLTLVEPSRALEHGFFEMVDAYRKAGEIYERAITRGRNLRPIDEYLEAVRKDKEGIGLPAGAVPCTTYWLVRNEDTIVATSYLRHRLSRALRHEGGHIGYTVRPDARGHGYGTRICALTIEKCRERGIDRILITCNADNLASARIIEKNGGILDSEVVSVRSGKMVRRYWIAPAGASG